METESHAGRARGGAEVGAAGTGRTRGDRGASIPEYAMMVALAAVVIIGAVQLLSGAFADVLSASLNGVQTGEVTDGAPGGGGGSGGGGGPTTTTPSGPSTTIAPSTTTTTRPSTTTTTRPCRRRRC